MKKAIVGILGMLVWFVLLAGALTKVTGWWIWLGMDRSLANPLAFTVGAALWILTVLSVSTWMKR